MYLRIYQKYSGYEGDRCLSLAEVFCGEVAFTGLEDVAGLLEREDLPVGGYKRLSKDDIVEVVRGSETVPRGEYVFNGTEFERSCVMSDMCGWTKYLNGKRMLWIEPGKIPLEMCIPDELYTLQRAVGGLIEFTYPFNDNVIVIGDDEAKLKGAKGNRRINGEIYAGKILIAGDGEGGKITDLTSEQIEKYKKLLGEPEIITHAEINRSMRMMFIPY